MKHLLIIISYLLFSLLPAGAQDVTVSARGPGVVRVGERFNISYTVNANTSGIEAPAFEGLRLLGGPSTSFKQFTNIVNGKVEKGMEKTFTFVLMALDAGNYKIQPATATVKGKTYKSNVLTIEVLPENSTGQSNKGQSGTQQQSTSTSENDQLFFRLIPQKRNVYIGEPVVITAKIFTKVSLQDLQNLKLPNFNGFYKQDMEREPINQLVRENVNGEIYYTGEINRVLLYPQKSGKLAISNATVDAIISRRSRSFFDDFFQSPTRQTLASPPITINVKDLPPAPKGFTGAVGNFRFSANLDQSETITNDAITLKVSITGTGNIKLVDKPKIDFPPSLEVFDPKINLTSNQTQKGASGTKTFEYLIIPRHAGTYRISPITFSFFNPKTEKYQSVSTKEFVIDVAKGEETEGGSVITGLSKEDVQFIGKDIQFIKQNELKLRNLDETYFGSGRFYLTYGISLLFFGMLVFFRKEQIKKNADISRVKNRKANKLARKRLKIANNHLKQGNSEKFYEETLKGLYGYLSDKLSIPMADLSKEKAVEAFENQQVQHDLQNQFIELLDTCEYARYAPKSNHQVATDDYEKAIQVITKLEQNLK